MWMWSTGINRNIVECKEVICWGMYSGDWVLIETLWNVKFNSAGGYWNIYYRINRNIVECKDMLQVVCGCQCRGY